MPTLKEPGYLFLIMGPMFSGKTSLLIKKYNEARQIGLNCCVVNYVGDTRYGENIIATHDGNSIGAVCVAELRAIPDLESVVEQCDCFFIDEAQFFPDLVEFVVELVDVHGKDVTVCGLNGDHKREVFGDIVKLIPHCDGVEFISGGCNNCGGEETGGGEKNGGRYSVFSKRVTSEEGQKLIGSDNYISVCRKCYLNN